MESSLQSGICFSPDIVNRLNDLAFQIDRRIFLFAYYEPKPYREDESWHARFCTAVINLYGLLKDCGPFLGAVLNDLKEDWHTQNVCDGYYQLLADSSAFRSIFCHNCSRKLQLNEEYYSNAEAYVLSHIYVDLPLQDLGPTHWKALLQALTISANSFADDLESALNVLIHSTDAHKRNNATKFWIKQIADSYQRNPNYLLHTMSALYQWYLENGGVKPKCHSGTSLRTQTTLWLRGLYEKDPERNWYQRWLSADGSGLESTNLYHILWDWPAKWAMWNDCDEIECDEPPLPGGPFFRILAYDVDQYAGYPQRGYDPQLSYDDRS
ncbi:hypothetical protein D1841_03625 [Neglecta sp. X4]|uniref:hypothetical protein n=1 Tax=unclassified Neglectibacter TaxID=2632164 RepID=UPI0013700960|nr:MULTISPECIES: hypothetical protein [unclassified Neglectibacter]NBI17016.1 hypothetical protein [Neglectibacter sp. 59]NBJ72428.1 hypothetical protein [Neglectibacter sp. X4]NCE80203.1 hypothetical protein [Neglectibacter sp. X58]